MKVLKKKHQGVRSSSYAQFVMKASLKGVSVIHVAGDVEKYLLKAADGRCASVTKALAGRGPGWNIVCDGYEAAEAQYGPEGVQAYDSYKFMLPLALNYTLSLLS